LNRILKNERMIKGIFLFILILISILTVQAQNSPEELGEKIFELFQNESRSFKQVVPTADQIMDKAQILSAEMVQNRVDDFNKEYPVRVKRFNEKCEAILDEGVNSGIEWQDIELDSIKPYKRNITVKNADKIITLDIIKLCIYFSSNQQKFVFILDTVLDFDGQLLVSDDKIVLNKIN
jgi:hypothetical protein